jgi:uncharacterized protein YdeI (YjbR/CyaY-like superfamily)
MIQNMPLLYFTSTIEIRDGNPYVLVEKELAQKIKSDWKKPLPVLIQVNGEPKKPLPDWFESALAQNETARKNWEALIPSRQKEILRYFSWLKSDEAKARNIEKALHVLSGGSGRFMARSWKDGR